MRVLVTGASGFVGGHLLEHLVEQGDEPLGLSSSGRWPESLRHLQDRVGLRALDLVSVPEPEFVGVIQSARPDAVVHLAAQANPQKSLGDPRATWALNLGGALNLLEAVKASGLKPRVLLVGSGVSYGNPAPEHLPVSELCPLRPNNPYSASKAAADILGLQHHLSFGTDVLMARPFNHAGPRQPDTYVLATLARQVAEVEAGLKPEIAHGNLEVVRDFTDVRDIVRAYRLLLEKGRGGEVYNIGTGRDVSLASMLGMLRNLARTNIPARVDPERLRPVDQPRLLADAKKLREETGWKPRYSLEQTLADMLESWREAVRGRR
jgi:GDP-4-dehydro-6-deoxy-D-mannose reductase